MLIQSVFITKLYPSEIPLDGLTDVMCGSVSICISEGEPLK